MPESFDAKYDLFLLLSALSKGSCVRQYIAGRTYPGDGEECGHLGAAELVLHSARVHALVLLVHLCR